MKIKFKMKNLQLVIVAAVCFFAFTNKAFGQFSGGDGSENNPYIITTAEQLAQLATFVNNGNETYNDKCYKLGNDISLSAYQSGAGWTPIGTGNDGFYGSFDGNGKKITGLYINAPDLDNVGLFRYVTGGATIKNLGLENVNITAREHVGCITAGLYNNSTITNCYVTGNIVGTYGASGIVSTVNTTCNISYCYSACNIKGNTYVGGIVGNIYGGSKVTNCYTTGDISGTYRVGGVVAAAYGYATIKNCYCIGQVIGDEQVGGIAGAVYDSGSLSYCVALNPSVKATTYYVGRVVGKKDGSLSSNAAWNGILNNEGNTFWDHIGADQLDGENMTLQQILADGTLGGRFTSTNGWTIQNGKLPGLFGQAVDMPAHLGGVGIETITNDELRITVFPNPTSGELIINNEQLIINNVEIYDVMGRKAPLNPPEGGRLPSFGGVGGGFDISHLPSGIYFLRIQTENGKMITKKVVKN